MIEDFEITQLLSTQFEKGFSLLFDKYYKTLVLCSLSLTNDFEVSEDIVQDLLYKFIHQKHYKNIDSHKLDRYLFSAVKNDTLNYLTRSKVKVNLDIQLFDGESEPYDELVLDDNIINEIRSVINDLPQRTKDIVTDITINNEKYADVAVKYGISVNTVKTLLGRGLKKIRESVSEKKLMIFFFLVTRF